MSKVIDITFRTFRLPDSLRASMRSARDAAELTNEAFVAQAVSEHLPKLVGELGKLGLAKIEGPMQPTRLPFSDTSGTLNELRAASHQVDIPIKQLLTACLMLASAPPIAVSKKRGRPRKSPSQK